MTYQDDPNSNRRSRQSYPMTEERNYTGWIVGAIVTLVLVAGIFMVFGRNDTKTATNTRPAATTSQPTTTGSGTSVPAPNSGNGTAGAPQQNVPTPRPAPAR
jgi:hypothetical protein